MQGGQRRMRRRRRYYQKSERQRRGLLRQVRKIRRQRKRNVSSFLFLSSDIDDSTGADITADHRGYWSSNGGSPNPDLFAPAYSQGWDDALLFRTHSAGASSIGFLDQWTRRRRAEYEAAHGGCGEAVWEWEHGFKQGVQGCQGA